MAAKVMTSAICTCGWSLKSRRGRLWARLVDVLFDLHERRCPDGVQ